ncbi:MAG: hypothetical protein IJV07_03180 [Alphaproteobacteria bacterium]|nr:hypothetical protein [Alphaproteobacteria bacterium]
MRQSNSGRTMMEMIGTISIMGILTIGAITGYRHIINRYRANTIISDVSTLAVLMISSETNQLPEKTENYEIIFPYENDSFFGITVDNVSQDVCRQIISLNWKEPVRILFNEKTIKHCKEINLIDFVFPKNAGIKQFEKCDSADDCAYPCFECNGIGICQEKQGEIIGYTDTTHNTIKSCQRCPQGSSYVDYTTQTECQKCGTGYVYADDRYCFNCQTKNGAFQNMKVSLSECQRCSNRCWTKGGECAIIDPINNPDNNGDGICDQLCPNNRTLLYTDADYKNVFACRSCGAESYYTTISECRKCGSNFAFDGKYCFYCDTKNTNLTHPKTSSNECGRCQNRCLNELGECVFFDNITVFRASDGQCISNQE